MNSREGCLYRDFTVFVHQLMFKVYLNLISVAPPELQQGEEEEGDAAASLDFLRNLPQFDQLRELVKILLSASV